MLMVQKYGGTSLGDVQRVRAAAKRITDLARQGIRMVVVVSAQADTTDVMIEKAAAVNKRGAAREMDAFLSAGEQMSAALMAMAIGAMGHPAVSLTGAQAGIHTEERHGDARILSVEPRRVLEALEGAEHRCEFDGINTVLCESGRFCAVPVTHRVTLPFRLF